MLNLFRHKKQYQIQVNRDSVCMGDDCDIHEVTMALPENMRLSQLLQWLADYVPPMKNVIWAIQSDIGICGYIITDSDANVTFELCGIDKLIEKMKISRIMCKYYCLSRFFRTDGQTGDQIEVYPECRTLLEKVKKANS